MRIAELVLEAYKKTGFIPTQDSFLTGNEACGLTALAVYSNRRMEKEQRVFIEKYGHEQCGSPVQLWGNLQFGWAAAIGFIQGFDDNRDLEPFSGLAPEEREKFNVGYQEGKRTWKLVRALRSRTPAKDSNTTPEQSETPATEEEDSTSYQPTPSSV